MYQYFFILFALCANGLLRNKGPGNFVSNNDEAIGKSKDMNAFGMSENGTLYLNSDSNLNETSSESFLENCNINSCVDINHENINTINNQKNDNLINNNNNLKVEYPNGINNNVLKAEQNEQKLSNKFENNTIHVNNDNVKKNTESAINIIPTQKENLPNIEKGEKKNNNKNKDKDMDNDDDEIDDEKDEENLDSSVEDEYKDSEDEDPDEDKEDDENDNENENEKPYKKVTEENKKAMEISSDNNKKETEISSDNSTKEAKHILGNNPENMTEISKAGSNLQTPKFRIHNEKDKIKINKERVENGNKRFNEYDIKNDNKMGNPENGEVDNGISNQFLHANNEKNFHEIQNSQNSNQHDERLQGKKVENDILDDNQLDSEKLDDEDSDDEDLDDEKVDGKKKNVKNDEEDEEDDGDEDESDDSIESKEINRENKSSFSKEIKNVNESTKNEKATDANQKIILNKDNKNYNEPDPNCSKVSGKVENTILQTTKVDKDIHQVKEKEVNTKSALNVSENNGLKSEQNYESNMFTIDKKMHNKLNNIDGIVHGLNDKLNHHKDLKNLELKLKFEAMGRIQKYKMYNEVIQKAIETLTQRLAKVNEDLNKLKEVSSISLQKYMNETGYGLESLNFPKSDLPLKKDEKKQLHEHMYV